MSNNDLRLLGQSEPIFRSDITVPPAAAFVSILTGYTRRQKDRTLVYDKGAYVLHLLREEMGERAFWRGLQIFTQRHFGKSVVTSDFIAAMEEANGKSLHEFFAKWVI